MLLLHTTAARSRPLPTRVLLLLAVLALALTACGGGADEVQEVAEGEAASTADLPEWINKLYPPPGSETSATQAVQVDHTAVAADRQVRLVIDGTDVTAYATETSPGLLEYDMDQTTAPVELEPGEHEAEVMLMEVTPGEDEGVDSYDPDVHGAIETYSWTFTIL